VCVFVRVGLGVKNSMVCEWVSISVYV
jgi:hypothetical protein